jgi:hypothetical protein
MPEAFFEDNFDTFKSETWEVKGNHTNFNVSASDGWLHMIFNKQSSEPGKIYTWASVCTRAPLDLSNKTVQVRFDLTPKQLQPTLPGYEYCVGVMLANKKDLQGHPFITPDIDLKGVIYYLRMAYLTPIQKIALIFDRGVITKHPGATFILFPPSEYEVSVGLTKVITYEEGVEDLTIPLPADPTNLYIHLFVFHVECGDYILPSRASFDYIRVVKAPAAIEYPKPEQALASSLQQVLPSIMVFLMISVLFSLLRRM